MRRVPALLVTAGLLTAALTGCSASTDSSCLVSSGSSSALVSASGAFGTHEKVSFPTPLHTTTVQRSTLKAGGGQRIGAGQPVETELTYVDGTTGKVAQQGEVVFVAGADSKYPGIGKALQCSTIGSRIAVTATAKQVFGADVSQTGLDAGHPLVMVLDLTKAYLAKANGAPQPGQPGFPAVVTAPNGQPGITVPRNNPPKTDKAEVLKQGDGRAITKSSSVLVQYTAVDWSDNSVTSSSWQDGMPSLWSMDKDAANGGAPAGIAKHLVGQRVGSQVVVILPASGADASAQAYVVDILGVR